MNPEEGTGASEAGREAVRYKGVWMRKWGKWVAEVRLPNSRRRIWLGTYDTPEKAARAFDAAAYCLRGAEATLNFSDTPPLISITDNMTPEEIREEICKAAKRYAHDGPRRLPEPDAEGEMTTTAPVPEAREGLGILQEPVEGFPPDLQWPVEFGGGAGGNGDDDDDAYFPSPLWNFSDETSSNLLPRRKPDQ